MTSLNDPATSLVATFTQSSELRREPEWASWYEREHLPAIVSLSGVTGATYWEVSGRAPGVLPAIGFTHVTFIDCDGDAVHTEQLLQALGPPRDGNGGGLHSLMDAEVLAPAGRWRRPPPSEESTGHVIAFAGPNDRLRQDD